MLRPLSLSALLVLPAAAEVAHWGNEVWTCGTSNFEMQIGDDESDIYLSRIVGHVTATPQSRNSYFSTNWDTKVRQSLVVLTYDAPDIKIKTRPETYRLANNEVDNGLLAVNAKTIGLNPVVLPINIVFSPWIKIPRGILRLRIDTDAPGPIREDRNCLNTETHLTFQW